MANTKISFPKKVFKKLIKEAIEKQYKNKIEEEINSNIVNPLLKEIKNKNLQEIKKIFNQSLKTFKKEEILHVLSKKILNESNLDTIFLLQAIDSQYHDVKTPLIVSENYNTLRKNILLSSTKNIILSQNIINIVAEERTINDMKISIQEVIQEIISNVSVTTPTLETNASLVASNNNEDLNKSSSLSKESEESDKKELKPRFATSKSNQVVSETFVKNLIKLIIKEEIKK